MTLGEFDSPNSKVAGERLISFSETAIYAGLFDQRSKFGHSLAAFATADPNYSRFFKIRESAHSRERNPKLSEAIQILCQFTREIADQVFGAPQFIPIVMPR